MRRPDGTDDVSKRANMMDKLQASEEPSPKAILELGFGYWGSKALLSAVELGLFSTLAGGPQELDALTLALGLHPRGAQDFLDALVALGMLQRNGACYQNTPAADRYLDRAKPSYIGGILEMTNAREYGFWNHLTTALHSGLPQSEAGQKEDVFSAMYRDPARLETFLASMTGLSMESARALARADLWAERATFADIGCAQGALPVQLALAHPQLRGVGFDLPQVGPIFNRYAQSHQVQDRVHFQAGDFFADPLPSAEVLILGHVLHDWNQAQRVELLSKAYAALPAGGQVIVLEALIDSSRKNAYGLLASLNMLVMTQGGSGFTAEECMGWLRAVGFDDLQAMPLAGADSIVTGIKRSSPAMQG